MRVVFSAKETGLELPGTVREAELLTSGAVQTHYRDSWTKITEADVDEALQAAEHMMAWAKSMLSTGRGGVTCNELRVSPNTEQYFNSGTQALDWRDSRQLQRVYRGGVLNQ